jgi:hypothetical protein
MSAIVIPSSRSVAWDVPTQSHGIDPAGSSQIGSRVVAARSEEHVRFLFRLRWFSDLMAYPDVLFQRLLQ